MISLELSIWLSLIILGVSLAIHYHKGLKHFAKEADQGDLEEENELFNFYKKNLPPNYSEKDGFAFTYFSQPKEKLSGDFCWMWEVDSQTTGIIIGDVCGKGIEAAGTGRDFLRFFQLLTKDFHDIKELCHKTNEMIFEAGQGELFIGLYILYVSSNEHSLKVVRMGMPPALWVKTEQLSAEWIEDHGIAAGIDKGDVFDRILSLKTLRFEEKDKLLLWSDGIIESFSEKIRWDQDQLLQVVKNNLSLSGKEILGKIKGEHDRFLNGVPPQDDITLLSIERL
jgi:sigma-B regulation protein RsbU (phosphoserine phosphatase)